MRRAEVNAAVYGKRLEANHFVNGFIVDGPPKIQRRVRYWFNPKSFQMSPTAWREAPRIAKAEGGGHFMHAVRDQLVRVERGWQVVYGKTAYQRMPNIWIDLAYAQAERDALQLSYARYLMEKK
jgi:hypothetical protein